jgi:hypothetical protein
MRRKKPPTMHAVDLQIPCPARGCLVRAGKECKGLRPGIVHFGRRLKRLLAARLYDWRDA